MQGWIRIAFAGWFAVAIAGAAHGQSPGGAFVKRGPFAGLDAAGDAAEALVITANAVFTPGAPPGAVSHRELYDATDPPGGGFPLASRGATLQSELGGDFQLDTAHADVDGDGRQEVVFASEQSDGRVRVAVIGTDFAASGPEERLTILLPTDEPTLRSMKPDANPYPGVRSRRVLKIAAGALDEDAADEIVVAYWADDGTIELAVLDDFRPAPSDTLTLRSVWSRALGSPREAMDALAPTDTSLHRTTATIGLATGDFDGDSIDEIALVYPEDPIDGFVWAGGVRIAFYEAATPETGDPVLVHRGEVFVDTIGSPAQLHFLNRIEAAAADLPPRAGTGFVGLPQEKLVLLLRTIHRLDDNRDFAQTRTVVADLDVDAQTRDIELRTPPVIGATEFEAGVTPGSGRGIFRPTARTALCMDVGNLDADGFDEIVVWDNDRLRFFDYAPGSAGGPLPEPLSPPLVVDANRGAVGETPILVPQTRLLGLVFPNVLLRPRISDCTLEIADVDGGEDPALFAPEILVDRLVIEEWDCPGFPNLPCNASGRSRQLGLDVWTVERDGPSGIVTGFSSQGISSGVQTVSVFDSIEVVRAMGVADLDDDRIRLGEPRVTRRETVQPLVYLSAPPTHFDVLDGITHDINDCYLGPSCGDFEITFEQQQGQSMTFSAELSSAWEVSTEIESSVLGAIETSLSNTYGRNFSTKNARTRSFNVTQTNTASQRDQILATRVGYELFEYPVFRQGAQEGFLSALVLLPDTPTFLSSASLEASALTPRHEPGNLLSYPTSAEVDGLSFYSSIAKQVTPTSTFQEVLSFASGTDQETAAETAWKIEGSTGAGGGLGSLFEVSVSVSGAYETSELVTHESEVTEEQTIEWGLGEVQDLTQAYTVEPVVRFDPTGALLVEFAVDLPSSGFFESVYGSVSDPALNLPRRLDVEKGVTQDASRALETKSLAFRPTFPEPGDNATIFARVYNFSLEPTDDRVVAHFYLGDPDDGGELIASTSTASTLAPRATEIVQIPWTVPDIDLAEARVFVELEPLGGFPELRSDNNLGWRTVNSIFVPAPSSLLQAVTALASLALVRRRRRGVVGSGCPD